MNSPRSTHGPPTIKTVLVGGAVGKTSLLRRYVDGKFSDAELPTKGTDFRAKMTNVDGEALRLILHDASSMLQLVERTWGQVFQTFRDARCFLFVHDVSDVASFHAVEQYLLPTAPAKALKVLVGNKSDLPVPMVDPARAQAVAERHGMRHLETSARTGAGVDELFDWLLRTATRCSRGTRRCTRAPPPSSCPAAPSATLKLCASPTRSWRRHAPARAPRVVPAAPTDTQRLRRRKASLWRWRPRRPRDWCSSGSTSRPTASAIVAARRCSRSSRRCRPSSQSRSRATTSSAAGRGVSSSARVPPTASDPTMSARCCATWCPRRRSSSTSAATRARERRRCRRRCAAPLAHALVAMGGVRRARRGGGAHSRHRRAPARADRAFTVWDYGGQAEYRLGHRDYLGQTRSPSVHLLVLSLTDGEEHCVARPPATLHPFLPAARRRATLALVGSRADKVADAVARWCGCTRRRTPRRGCRPSPPSRRLPQALGGELAAARVVGGAA